MTEYIEREAAIEITMQYCPDDDGSCSKAPADLRDLLDEIESIHVADVRPVVRGKWIDEPIKGIRYHCSVCQGRFDYTWHFCPNCGADMREES